MWKNHNDSMSFNVLQQERCDSDVFDLTVTPYILNKSIILID